MKRNTAIAVIKETPVRFVKYHNINSDNPKRFFKFLKDKFDLVSYVNFYDPGTDKFIERVYVDPLEDPRLKPKTAVKLTPEQSRKLCKQSYPF